MTTCMHNNILIRGYPYISLPNDNKVLIVKMLPKAARLVIFCCFLIHMSMIGSDICFFHTVKKDGVFAFLLSQSVAYLLYPLLGWLADVYFTRYKFVLISFILMIGSTIIMSSSAALFLNFNHYRSIFILSGFSLVLGLIAMGLFESTATQFGMDQMLEASSDQLSLFVHWYYWCCNVGRLLIVYCSILVLGFYSQCTITVAMESPSDLFDDLHPSYFIVMCSAVLVMDGLQLACACIGLCVVVYYKKHFNIDRTGDHPLKLIYNVLKYAWNHKCPERRSAFTYWEEDIPPRIDLGKSKYGGPFTTEEVEDTKTFFSILLLLFSLFGFHLSGHGYSTLDQIMREQCPSHWTMVFLADPVHPTFFFLVIGVPLQNLLSCCCRGYFPNMLKRMGLGLFCCLIKAALEITAQALITQKEFCDHFDNNTYDSCYFLSCDLNINNACVTISNATDNFYYCKENNLSFLLLLIPNTLQGLAILLVFITALEFICAQAPLRLKGLLIGVWYAFLAINYLLVEAPEQFTIENMTWKIFHGIKAGFIFLSLVMYLYVSRRYRYRLRDEVVNEQYLIEEIYERELALAEQEDSETDSDETSDEGSDDSYLEREALLESKQNYGSVQN